MYTANIVDTVIFRALGQPPNPQFQSLERAARETDADIWVPATVYEELRDDSVAGTAGPVNPYLDPAIEDGWIRVATSLPGSRNDDWEAVTNATEKARHLTDAYLNQASKYPETNNWNDSAIVGLAVRLFEENDRMRVITHTADELLARACTIIPPEFGYYDVRSEFYNPPQSAKTAFPTTGQLSW